MPALRHLWLEYLLDKGQELEGRRPFNDARHYDVPNFTKFVSSITQQLQGRSKLQSG